MKIFIDDKECEVRDRQTILEAALSAGIYIPHLCYHPDLPSFRDATPTDVCYRGPEAYRTDDKNDGYQGCGICLVEIKGKKEPVLSCINNVEDGMEITTSSAQLERLRKQNLASILANHPHACLLCAQKEGCSLTQCSTNVPQEERCCPQFDYCELRKIAEYVGIKEDIVRYMPRYLYVEEDKPLFVRDYNLCVGCLRCVRVCEDVVGARSFAYTLTDGDISAGSIRPSLEESGCVFCGACVEVCPTGALRDRDIKPDEKKDALIPCVARCPVGMDIPSYIRSIANKKYDEAATTVNERVPFASALGYICHHPCEEECRQKELNQAIAICGLKRFAVEKGKPKIQPKKKESTGKNVVIVGSGPAGLVAAYFLARLGHSVRVYEAQSESGGMLRWAIPDYRLPLDVIRKEIEDIKAVGVEILTDTPIKEGMFLEELNQKIWDAIFLATGAQESKKIEVDGLSSEEIHWGLEFLRKTKEGKGKKIKGKVVVIGGGNVALDVAMTALRLGAPGVELACLEKRKEMPAFTWEIQEAEQEGVIIHAGWGPSKINREEKQIKGIELIACTSVFDQQGCFCPEFDSSKKKFLKADEVILAVGQKVDLSFIPSNLGIKITDEKTLEVNPETLETNVPGVFAGGEATLGPATAVEAMAMGRTAASYIDKFLGGEGILDIDSTTHDEDKQALWRGQEENFYSRERVSLPTLAPDQRLRSFDLIQLGYREEEAVQEASRCLRCDLRLRLTPVTLPPEKWLDFTAEVVNQVPRSEAAFELLDGEKNVIYIAGTPNLRGALQELLFSNKEAKYFRYEEDPMYTKRESELIQQFLQKHGHLPPGNEEVEDLF